MRARKLTRILIGVLLFFTFHPLPFISMNVYAASKGNPPIAHWRFDESGGPTAYDESANNNDGTLNAGASGTNTTVGQMWTRQGKIGGALECDGTNDYVNIPINSSLQPQSELTLEAWIKPDSAYVGDIIILGQSAYYLTYSSNGSVNGYWYGKNPAGYHNAGSGAATADTWNHIVAVWSTTTVKIYVNGVEKFSTACTGTGNVAQNQVWLGAEANGTTRQFHGLIDDVKIYNYARTADQILVDYNAGTAVHLGAGTDPNEGNPPIAYYSFDENTGQTGYDRSGSSNNGTLGSTSGSDANDPVWSAGKYGSALKFDGTNDMVEVLDTNNALDLTTAGTIECWAYINNSYRFWIAAKCASASNPLSNYYFGTGSGNTWLGGIGNGTTDQGCSDPSVAPTGIWTHAAFTFDGTKLKLYINGIKVNEINQTITPLANNDHLSIGCWGTATSYPANGYIDEIKIYNYARTQSQIAYDYNKGKPIAHYKFEEGGGAISHNEYSQADSGISPAVWWRMDNASSGSANGATVADGTGNDNNGTANYGANVTGMTWTAGKIGLGALNFDGTDDYVIKNPVNNFPTTAITAEFWMKSSDTTKAGSPVSYASTGGDNNFLIYDYRNFSIYVGTTNIGTGISANDGNWNHIAVTWQSSNGAVKLYKNGISVFSGTVAAGTAITQGGSLVLGQEQDSTGGGFDPGQAFLGQMDDVRIYNYVRTAEQIYNDYKTTHGTLAGNTKFVDGKIGKALQFDGTEDYVSSGNDSDLNVYQTMTLEAWVKASSAAVHRAILARGRGANYWNGYEMSIESGHRLRVTCETTGGSPSVTFDKTGTVVIDDNNWHHVAFTFDGTTGTLYVDGKSDGSTTGSFVSCDQANYIGKRLEGSYFTGLIDDVRIYNYARSVDQVLQDYNAGLITRLGAQSAGEADPWGGAMPVACWTMDDNTGVIAQDVSGNAHNAIFNKGVNGTGLDWKQGKNGPALDFDGNDDYLNFSSSPVSVNTTSGFTLSGFVKIDSLNNPATDWHVILRAPGFEWGVSAGDGKLVVYKSPGNVAVSSQALVVGTWYHVAMTASGSTVKQYINGIVDGTASSDLGSLSFDYIGQWSPGNADINNREPWNGVLDDIRIYNYARTQAQIAWDYNRGKPVARWRFDEATSGSAVGSNNIKDNSGNARHGSGSGSNIAWVAGKSGGALSFNGTNDYVNCGTNSTFNFQEGNFWTVSLWMKTSTVYTGIQGGKKLLTKATGNARSGYAVAIGQINSQGYDNKIGFVIDGAPGNNYVKSFNTLPVANDGNWHHVAIVFDASTNVKVGASIYFDGVNYGYVDSTVNKAGWISDATRALNIGSGDGIEYFTGQIDDARIYNYARTADQILQDYNAGLAVKLGE